MSEAFKSANEEATGCPASRIFSLFKKAACILAIPLALATAGTGLTGCAPGNYRVNPDGSVNYSPALIGAALYPDGVYGVYSNGAYFYRPYSADIIIGPNGVYGPFFAGRPAFLIPYVAGLYVTFDTYRRPFIRYDRPVVINNVTVERTFILGRYAEKGGRAFYHHPQPGQATLPQGELPPGHFGQKQHRQHPNPQIEPRHRQPLQGERQQQQVLPGPRIKPDLIPPPPQPQPQGHPGFGRPQPRQVQPTPQIKQQEQQGQHPQRMDRQPRGKERRPGQGN
ncbi:MAG: hypothetical protein PHY92_07360 [Alphaproteobacteria bacterium]|nr:hypothetical protein [Alphaproteobacteria bacterium]